MDTWEKRHASAQNHVNVVRSAIDRQRSIVAGQKALRLNTQASEELLAAIEHSQEIFEGNLARITDYPGFDRRAATGRAEGLAI
jgi:hypothetical protein